MQTACRGDSSFPILSRLLKRPRVDGWAHLGDCRSLAKVYGVGTRAVPSRFNGDDRRGMTSEGGKENGEGTRGGREDIEIAVGPR